MYYGFKVEERKNLIFLNGLNKMETKYPEGVPGTPSKGIPTKICPSDLR